MATGKDQKDQRIKIIALVSVLPPKERSRNWTMQVRILSRVL